MEEYIEFFKNFWLVIKAFTFEWFPIYEEMESAAWGPFANVKEFIGTITAIGAILFAVYKFWDKYYR